MCQHGRQYEILEFLFSHKYLSLEKILFEAQSGTKHGYDSDCDSLCCEGLTLSTIGWDFRFGYDLNNSHSMNE